jgi:hypothetical protein
MRRYRLREFNNHKIRLIQEMGGNRPPRLAQPIGTIPWENDYYHYKEQLSSVNRRSKIWSYSSPGHQVLLATIRAEPFSLQLKAVVSSTQIKCESTCFPI